MGRDEGKSRLGEDRDLDSPSHPSLPHAPDANGCHCPRKDRQAGPYGSGGRPPSGVGAEGDFAEGEVTPEIDQSHGVICLSAWLLALSQV